MWLPQAVQTPTRMVWAYSIHYMLPQTPAAAAAALRYQTATDAAEVLDWGREAGCVFVLGSCWDYMDKHKQQPYYCGKGSLNETRCTAEAAGWGVCRMNAFSDGEPLRVL